MTYSVGLYCVSYTIVCWIAIGELGFCGIGDGNLALGSGLLVRAGFLLSFGITFMAFDVD